MEAGNFEEGNLETIIQVLENIELNNLSRSPEIIQWVENITKPEFQLVDSLIKLFLDNSSDIKNTTNILKVLRKFLIYNRDNVVSQIKNNPNFPKTISNYIITSDKKALSGDAFFLLSDFYQTTSFKDVTNEEFMKALFDGLGIITDEDNFNAIVKIMTQINYEQSVLEYKIPLANIFIKVFQTHENSRILIESLIRILNHEDKDKEVMYKVLQCFIDMMEANDDTVMYSSDLESFINLSIKKLESTYTEDLRFYILTVLEKIMQYEEYFKTKYKIDELIECMESYIEHANIDQSNKNLCTKILKLINEKK